MPTVPLTIPLTVRDLTLDDLPDLDWSGGTAHLAHVAEKLVAAQDGTCRVLGVVAPNGLIVAKGGVAFGGLDDPPPPGLDRDDIGVLWMLSVRESWQSLGVGTVLTQGLERAARDRGRSHAVLSVEHDNPRAAALYRRLGYTAYGSWLAGWPTDHASRYVTVCTLMVKPIPPTD